MIYRCLFCKKEYQERFGDVNKFCSLKCYWDNGRKEFNCANCKKIFISFSKSNRKYCSKNCYFLKTKRKPKACKACKKKFIHNSHRTAKYCSRKCASKERDTRTLMRCKICRKKLLIPRCLKKRKKFCSYKCMGRWQSIYWVKEGSPSWRGGIKKDRDKRKSYDVVQWRKKVFKRDNWTCVWCGKRGGELQADHIKPYAKYPNLRTKLSNGRTLCITCHRTTDTYGAKSK